MSNKIETIKTGRQYDLEFEGKEIEIFYYPKVSVAFKIDVDNMVLLSYNTIYNTDNSIGMEGLSNEGISSELQENIYREIEEFYDIHLVDFGVVATNEESIVFEI